MKLITLFFAFLTSFAFAANVPDYEKEKRWAEHVESGLMDGDMVWVPNGDREFMSILTESESETKKAAIVVHGLGVHPDWSGVIQPLRVSLTTQGYHTLSIQMPVRPNGEPGEEYMGLLDLADKRIDSAIKYLQDNGYDIDLLVAHSFGTTMSSHYLANSKSNPIKRYVAVGMGVNSVKFLPNISIPIFDVYGTEDLESIMNSVGDRAKASKHNASYTQKMIKGDHFFNGQDALLIQTVANWLK